MALGTPTDILDSLFCRNEGDVSRLAGRGRLSSDASADRGLRAGKAAKAAGQRLGDVSRTSGITVPPLTSHLDDSAQACPITAVVKLTPITADVARCRRFAASMSNGPVNRPPLRGTLQGRRAHWRYGSASGMKLQCSICERERCRLICKGSCRLGMVACPAAPVRRSALPPLKSGRSRALSVRAACRWSRRPRLISRKPGLCLQRRSVRGYFPPPACACRGPCSR